VNLARTIHAAAFRWTPVAQQQTDTRQPESREARAERSLAHLEEVLEMRQRWRHRVRVMAVLAVPILLTLFARQARGAFA
jgi:hypothetical protein